MNCPNCNCYIDPAVPKGETGLYCPQCYCSILQRVGCAHEDTQHYVFEAGDSVDWCATCGAKRITITDEGGDTHRGAWRFPAHASKADQGIIDGVG